MSKRSEFFLFLNTSTSGSAATYNLVGDGVTELTISYNPQTNTEQFIHQDTATTNITGYQPNAPVTAQAVKGDPVFEYANAMRKTLPVMEKAYSDVVMVDLYESPTSGTAYAAVRQPVSIQIDSYGGAATDPLSIGYTLNWRGDGEAGTFDTSTKTFTKGGGAEV